MNFSPLTKRVISAVAAILLLLALILATNSLVLTIFAIVVIFYGIFEFMNMVFEWQKTPFLVRGWFFCCCGILQLLTVLDITHYFSWLMGITALFFAVSVWLTHAGVSNQELLSVTALSSLGFIHSGIFPALVVRLLTFPNGKYWFLAVLVCVFTGDTFAYFGGRFWGKHKLHTQLSPNKTIEGAIAGALGSVVVMAFWGPYFLGLPAWISGLCGLLAAFFGQSGDLFVSLIKRVAGLKDSGHIMPGHGGILDRLDGVYMAGPLFYLIASIV